MNTVPRGIRQRQAGDKLPAAALSAAPRSAKHPQAGLRACAAGRCSPGAESLPMEAAGSRFRHTFTVASDSAPRLTVAGAAPDLRLSDRAPASRLSPVNTGAPEESADAKPLTGPCQRGKGGKKCRSGAMLVHGPHHRLQLCLCAIDGMRLT